MLEAREAEMHQASATIGRPADGFHALSTEVTSNSTYTSNRLKEYPHDRSESLRRIFVSSMPMTNGDL